MDARLWLGFAGTATCHVAALAGGGRPRLAAVTKRLLMPALGVALTGLHDRPLACGMTAIGASWVGDVLGELLTDDPRAEVGAMAACFAVAHGAYIVAFLPALRRRPQPAAAAVSTAVAGTVVAACLPRAGAIAPAVVGYGALLAATVSTAWGNGRWGRVGGAGFLASDALLALRLFRAERPAPDWLIMTLYCVGQAGLIRALHDVAA